MAELTTAQYDALERAIIDRRRIALYRRGTEYLVIPEGLELQGRREVIRAVHPTTGEHMEFALDEVEAIELVPAR